MALLTPYLVVDGLIALLSLAFAFYLYMGRNFNYWKKRGVIQENPSPIFGNFGLVFLLKDSPGEVIKRMYRKYQNERYAGFYIFDKPALMVRDPELIKHVLIRDFNNFSNRYASPSVHDRLGYANLFMIKNPAWKTLRQKLSPIYSSGRLKKMYELMMVVGEHLESYLETLTLDGKDHELEMKEMFARFTTDMIASTAYGLQTNSVENPDSSFRKFGKKVFEFDLKRSYEFLTIFFLPHMVDRIGAKFFGQETTMFFKSAFWDAFNLRMESKEKRNDLIDLLIELRDANKGMEFDGFKFEGDDLLSQAAVFFTGGFETSSTAMSFSLFELARYPELQEKARCEINDALEASGGKVNYDVITNLPYLDMVIAEALRMYPPLPFLDRVAENDYKLAGSDLVIEKGTPVYISMTGVHYDPEYFPDPDRFDPERFSEENKKNRPACTYFPFGEGPHICIGLRIGLLQAKLGLIHFLRKWEAVPSPKTVIPARMGPALITQAKDGLYLNVRKITTAAG